MAGSNTNPDLVAGRDGVGANFDSIPILDYSLLSSPSTKPLFISQLRNALINVGFFYLSNHPISTSIIDSVISSIPKLFDLPQEEKEKVGMVNSPHFLGYTRLGAELTKGRVDYREQFDIALPFETMWRKGGEKDGIKDHWGVFGPCQWPDESVIPGIREILERYLEQLSDLSYVFNTLVAEALGLAPDALNKFFGSPESIQHRGKIVKYPVVTDPSANGQGVGPHYDGGFLTFLLQASSHRGLQVQNLSGKWIDASPIPGTFVVNLGKSLEYVTQGVARATSHRVISPRAAPDQAQTPRYSVPFFQYIALDVCLADHILDLPPEILSLKEDRGIPSTTEAVNFGEFNREPAGMVMLIGRIKSHPDVAERHYPGLFKKYFPDGMPDHGMAY